MLEKNESGKNLLNKTEQLNKIEQLINETKLSEALENLKLIFQSKKLTPSTYKLFGEIVTAALEQNDLVLALNAASYDGKRHKKVQKFIPWKAILLKTYQIVEQLIKEKKLAEALENLKLIFKEGKITKTTWSFLNQIITNALEKNDFVLTVNAASFRNNLYTLLLREEVPESISWNTIVHKIYQAGKVPHIDTPIKFLTPGVSVSTPFKLNDLACQIWKLFQENNWKIPSFDVEFSADSMLSLVNPQSVYQISKISGEDFIIGFSGGQFSYIAIPNFIMEFYENDFGPLVYKYTGDKWQENIARMSWKKMYYESKSEWQKIECYIPKNRFLFIDFDKNAQEIQSRREIQQEFIAIAIIYFENIVLPKLRESILEASNESNNDLNSAGSIIDL